MSLKKEDGIPLYMHEIEEVIDLTNDDDDVIIPSTFEEDVCTPVMQAKRPMLEPPALSHPFRRHRGFLQQFDDDDIVELPAAQPIELDLSEEESFIEIDTDEESSDITFDDAAWASMWNMNKAIDYPIEAQEPVLGKFDLDAYHVLDDEKLLKSKEQMLIDSIEFEEDSESDDTEVVDVEDDEIEIETEPVDLSKNNGQGPKRRMWMVTYNNPTVTCKKMTEMLESNKNVKGYAFNLEKGKCGTPHFQMYLELNEGIYYTGVKSILNNKGAHCELPKSKRDFCIKYCTKEETRVEGPFAWGTCLKLDKPGEQGKRSDIAKIGQAILDEGGVSAELMEQYPGEFIRFNKQIKSFSNDIQVEKMKDDEFEKWCKRVELEEAGEEWTGQEQRHLELFVGPTNCRKTTRAKMTCAKRKQKWFEKDGKNKWWDGYRDEKCVIIDEFMGDYFGSIEQFNLMTNVGCAPRETKGGHVTLMATHIYFTSNTLPCEWWKKPGDDNGHYGWSEARYQAVARRFRVVHWWDHKMQYHRLENPEYGSDMTTKAQWEAFWKWRPTKSSYTLERVGQGKFEQRIIGEKSEYFEAPIGLEDYPVSEWIYKE